MLISYNWLKQYIPSLNTAPEELADKLKMSTVEVEGIKKHRELLGNVVVGKVVSCEKHPNADKLKVCKVDIGADNAGAENIQPVQVVCGGSNVRDGMLVALAKIGAKVKWHGEGEPVELQPAKIRGVESQGMICASTEIGLGEMFPLREEKEILDLGFVGNAYMRSLQPGKPLAEVLGLNDVILEIDNKTLSHRPDLWGHYGIAREAAALFSRKLESYKVIKLEISKEIKLKVKVEDPKLCPRYMAVALTGVKVAESPDWLKQRLVAVGLRPINNIVDITNYVMMDLGQPMHAFDAKKLTISAKGGSASGGNNEQLTKVNVEVRRASDGEVFRTLDGVERKLDSSMLVIANEEKAIAIAGVMGGEESGVSENTDTIIFESANFDAASVRKTSTALGLRTDSSARFEKSLDPNLCELAIKKAVELTLEICPEAKAASKAADVKDFVLPIGPISIPKNIFAKLLGVEIPLKEILQILERLGFEVKEKGEELSVKIPTWRATKDISIPEDVAEEAGRIYGFNNIESSLPQFPITPPEITCLQKLERQARQTLVQGSGYTEVYNYSFVSPWIINKLGDSVKDYLELDNPISAERPYIRRHLIHNLLENVLKNIASRDELKLVEIGKVYRQEEPGVRALANGDELLPRQDLWLGAVYVHKKNEAPFWQARRAGETLMAELGQSLNVEEVKVIKPWQHPARAGEIVMEGKVVGQIYEVHPTVLANLGIEPRVGMLELNLTALSELSMTETKYSSVSLYPQVERDLAILVRKEVGYREIASALKNIDPLLKSVELFDVYEGRNLGEGYKSMAFHLVFENKERTLTAEEVEKAREKAVKKLKERFDITLR